MRRTARWALAAAVAVVGVVAAGWPFLVAPAHDEPADVDAVLVLGPPTDARMEIAWQMIDGGLADHLLVSLDPWLPEGTFPLAEAACAYPGDLVACTKPDPFTTRGEAQWLRDEAAANSWDSVAVITFTPHISRSRMIVQNCFEGEVLMVEESSGLAPHYWAYQYAYQSAATVKALLQGDCGEPDPAAATRVFPATDGPDPSDSATVDAVDDHFSAGQDVPDGFPESSDYARQVFEAANVAREQHGVEPLEWSECLADVAAGRAATVLPLGELVHAGVKAQCGDGTNYAGENLIHGIYLPDQAVEAWLGSPSHRAALLDPRFSEVGVACVASSLAQGSSEPASGADDVGGMLCSMNFEGTAD